MSSKNPTPMQQQAIKSKGKMVLKSCPGSGKTFVVAKKMIEETETWKHKNRGIALLSFTNVANEEVIKQICNMANIKKIDYPHFVGTIDSFISQWIFLPFGHLIMKCEDRPTILLDSSNSIFDYANTIWRKECYKLNCIPIDFYVDIDKKLKHQGKEILACPIDKNKPCFRFKKYCFSRGYATYSDVVSISLILLEQYPEIGKLLAKRFSKFIIDEAQDTSANQMKIIDKFAENGVEDIMIIGDPDQAIYEWRDADPSVFLDKYNDSAWEKQLLNENFRCSQNICNATFVFSSLKTISIAKGDTANANFKPLVVRYNPTEKDKVITEFICLCKQEDIEVSPEKVAVLVRGTAGLFGKDYSSIRNLWQSRESRLLSEAAYERDFGSLRKAISLVEKALFYIFVECNASSDDVDEEKVEKIVEIDIWRKLVHAFIIDMPGASVLLKNWKEQINLLINNISSQYRLNKKNDNPIKIKARDKECPDFLIQPIKYFYARSADSSEFLNSTIHAVKGRTFEAVLLILSTNGKLTANVINSKPINNEEVRTAYVAMTRAKKILVVAIPNTVKEKSLVRFNKDNWDVKSL